MSSLKYGFALIYTHIFSVQKPMEEYNSIDTKEVGQWSPNMKI